MNIIELLLNEVEQEAQTTRKMLALVPFDKAEWAPHEKSMKMNALAVHIAELPGWIKMGLETDELDFETAPYNPVKVENTTDLLDHFEKNLKDGVESLKRANLESLADRWVLRNGETILVDTNRYGIIRIAISQTIHHRAQLGVYLRLLTIPIPGSYGPSADDQNF